MLRTALIAGAVLLLILALDHCRPEYRITAYCSCEKCCKKSDGITASGANAIQGYCATRDLPFRTVIEIEGVGIFKIMDRGPVDRRHIDIWFPTHRQALEFGTRKSRVKVLGLKGVQYVFMQ